jgi:hypothetical protein
VAAIGPDWPQSSLKERVIIDCYGLEGAFQSMNITPIHASRTADIPSEADEPTPQMSNGNARRPFLRIRDSFSSERMTSRMQRDLARGYSINVKQVVLARRAGTSDF